MTRFAAAAVLLALLTAGCGSSMPPQTSDRGSDTPPAPGTITHGDASTDLETTPLSAADYAMYSAVMSGASAMLTTLTPTDREALTFARQVDAGQAKVTPDSEHLLAQARALQQKDVELARMQGIEARYVKVKAKIEAVIGPHARPPAPDDKVAQENLRYLEPHRATIERLQRRLREPLGEKQ